MRTALTAAALLALLATPLAAQDRPQPVAAPVGMAPLPVGPQARALTLAEAEARLVEQNLTVIAARRGVDAARAQRLVASSLPPAQVSIGNNFATFDETRRGGVTNGRYRSPLNNLTLGLQVLVERGGKRELRTRVADQNIEVAEAQVLDTLRTQVFALRQAFLGALLARANLEVALANRSSLDRTENLLRRQLRDGAIPEGDLLRFQASRLQFEGDVTSNAQAYAAGVAAVAALLAADPADFQAGAGSAAALGLARGDGTNSRRRGSAPADAPTTVRTVLSPVAFDLRGRFDTVPSLEIGRDQLAAGITSRADVVAAAKQAEAAGSNRLLAEAARSRDVTVSPGWSRSRLPQDLPGPAQVRGTDTFGLQLSVPIFTRRITEGNVGVATAQQGQADALARAALLQARADFATAWATFEQARALLGLYTGGALQRAEEAYRSAEQAYLAGGRSLLDVLDAVRTLNATRMQANQARYAYLLSLAQLEAATGVSGISPRL